LQEYPYKTVVLLIDNPPQPTDKDDQSLLQAARQLPLGIQNLMDKAADQFSAFLRDYEERLSNGLQDAKFEITSLHKAYLVAAKWFKQQAQLHYGDTHSGKLFVKLTYLEPAQVYFDRARQLENILQTGGPWLTAKDIHVEYLRLVSRFQVSISFFERKRYINLSHESNKAMNLNSYISLLG
jgi:hypothetical protein